MSDGPEWFAPKRFGYGAGLPISWQGWALTATFIVVVVSVGLLFRGEPIKIVAAIAPFLVAFLVICARTTRGGWRWRWGNED